MKTLDITSTDISPT